MGTHSVQGDMEGFQNPKTGPQRRGFPQWGLRYLEEL